MPNQNDYNQSIKIIHFKYEEACVSQRSQIKSLLRSIWAEHDSQDVHSPFFKVVSFCAYSDEYLVGYAAVLSWQLRVKQEMFNACGLSCVCTHPDYRRNGIGGRIVTEATRWIMKSGFFDFGIFTCNPRYTKFYETTKIWEKDDSLVVQGSISNEFVSRHMGLDVLKCVISENGQANSLTDTTLVLHFPDGEFI